MLGSDCQLFECGFNPNDGLERRQSGTSKTADAYTSIALRRLIVTRLRILVSLLNPPPHELLERTHIL